MLITSGVTYSFSMERYKTETRSFYEKILINIFERYKLNESILTKCIPYLAHVIYDEIFCMYVIVLNTILQVNFYVIMQLMIPLTFSNKRTILLIANK